MKLDLGGTTWCWTETEPATRGAMDDAQSTHWRMWSCLLSCTRHFQTDWYHGYSRFSEEVCLLALVLDWVLDEDRQHVTGIELISFSDFSALPQLQSLLTVPHHHPLLSRKIDQQQESPWLPFYLFIFNARESWLETRKSLLCSLQKLENSVLNPPYCAFCGTQAKNFNHIW